jgi:hypothetical protein
LKYDELSAAETMEAVIGCRRAFFVVDERGFRERAQREEQFLGLGKNIQVKGMDGFQESRYVMGKKCFRRPQVPVA